MDNSSDHKLCIGVIMDGNRRYAKARGMSTLEGHKAGLEAFRTCADAAIEQGIGTLIFYAFSTENWNRNKDEVEGLMDIMRQGSKEGTGKFEELKQKGVRLRFIGDIERFPKDLSDSFRKLEEETKDGKTMTVALALSYGGRPEILQAVEKLLANPPASGKVSEAEFSKLLWTHDLPDPDIVIRTSGEMRLSNFLPWQSVYSELFFLEKMWPEFSKEDLIAVLEKFASRERRRGK